MKLLGYSRSEGYLFDNLPEWAQDEVDPIYEDREWIIFMPDDAKRRRVIPLDHVVRLEKAGRWQGSMMLSAFDGFFVRISNCGSGYLIAHYMW